MQSSYRPKARLHSHDRYIHRKIRCTALEKLDSVDLAQDLEINLFQ